MKSWNEWIIVKVTVTKKEHVFIYSEDGYSNGNFAILHPSFFEKEKDKIERELEAIYKRLTK
jgi:hypothetical protein